MEERVDERTGARSNVIVESKDLDVRPRISIKDESGKTAQAAELQRAVRALLPAGRRLHQRARRHGGRTPAT